MDKQNTKQKMARIWTAGNKDFTCKGAAYRHCRHLNDKKSGGRRTFNVQRKFA